MYLGGFPRVNDQSRVENSDGDTGTQLHEDELSPEHVDHQIGRVLGLTSNGKFIRLEVTDLSE